MCLVIVSGTFLIFGCLGNGMSQGAGIVIFEEKRVAPGMLVVCYL